MKLELHATPEDVMRAVEAVQELARTLGLSEADVFGIALAVEECGANIVNHALQRDSRQIFHVEAQASGSDLTIELRDRGPQFDPCAAADRELKAQEEDLPGGWGIQLVRCYMDKISYRREAGENVLRLTKNLPSSKEKVRTNKPKIN